MCRELLARLAVSEQERCPLLNAAHRRPKWRLVIIIEVLIIQRFFLNGPEAVGGLIQDLVKLLSCLLRCDSHLQRRFVN